MPNITLSADKHLLDRAREVARRQGTSLNELVRGYLRSLVGQESGMATADELLGLMETHGGHSAGRRWRREDAYEGRV